MKQNYKAFAPDISTGGTTIKDGGNNLFPANTQTRSNFGSY